MAIARTEARLKPATEAGNPPPLPQHGHTADYSAAVVDHRLGVLYLHTCLSYPNWK